MKMILSPVESYHYDPTHVKALLALDVYKATKPKLDQILNFYLCQQNSWQLHLAIYKDKVLGLIGVKKLAGHKVFIQHIAVDPKIHWKGVGRFMLEQLPKQQAIRIIEAEPNEKHVGFYQACGFDPYRFPSSGNLQSRFHCVQVTKLLQISKPK